MSPRWLFFPSAVAAYRQEITYTLVNTSWTNMTISNSTGDAILKTTVSSWPPNAWQNPTAAQTFPRLVFGTYLSGYTTGELYTFFGSIEIISSINGGTDVSLGSPVGISGLTTAYLNANTHLGNASALSVGDSITYKLLDI